MLLDCLLPLNFVCLLELTRDFLIGFKHVLFVDGHHHELCLKHLTVFWPFSLFFERFVDVLVVKMFRRLLMVFQGDILVLHFV